MPPNRNRRSSGGPSREDMRRLTANERLLLRALQLRNQALEAEEEQLAAQLRDTKAELEQAQAREKTKLAEFRRTQAFVAALAAALPSPPNANPSASASLPARTASPAVNDTLIAPSANSTAQTIPPNPTPQHPQAHILLLRAPNGGFACFLGWTGAPARLVKWRSALGRWVHMVVERLAREQGGKVPARVILAVRFPALAGEKTVVTVRPVPETKTGVVASSEVVGR